MKVRCYWCEGTGNSEPNSLVRIACTWCDGQGELDGAEVVRTYSEQDSENVARLIAYTLEQDPQAGAELEKLRDSLAWDEDPWGRQCGAMNCRKCGLQCTKAEVSNTYDADWDSDETGYRDWFCCAACLAESKRVA